MDSDDGVGSSRDSIDLTSPDPPIFPSQHTVARSTLQTGGSLEQSHAKTTNITMSSDKPLLFRPPAFTLDLFNEYVDDDDNTIEEGSEVTVLSSAQKSNNRTLLPGFTTPDQTSRGTPSSDDIGLFVRPENHNNDNIDGDGYNYDDDDEVGVFANRRKPSRPFRTTSNPHVTTPRLPTLTQQGQRLPKHLRSGYRRGRQDILMGGEYQEFDYTPNNSRRGVSTQSYGCVHTTLPATNFIPTGGGGFLVTNSFMSIAQRKRLEQQENIEKVLTDLDECLAANPTDYKLRAKKLHLEELQRRLMESDSTALKGPEAALIKDVEKMLERRRMNMAKVEYEKQAKAMVENMSSAGTHGRKRAYDEGIGSMTPLSSTWSETAAPLERSSFSHPSTGGKTVPQSYYHRQKRGTMMHGLEGNADADDEFKNDKDDDEDVVWDDGSGRKTYGGKTVAQDSLGLLSDYDTAKVLTEAIEREAGDKKDECAAEDSGDDVDGTSDDDTDDGHAISDKRKGDSDGKRNDDGDEESDTDEEDVAGGKGDESKGDENEGDNKDDEMQKETEEKGGNGDANE